MTPRLRLGYPGGCQDASPEHLGDSYLRLIILPSFLYPIVNTWVMASYKGNIWKANLLTLFIGMFLFSSVLVPFFTEWGGITLAQVLFLQSWFMLWIFILEIPTGTIADRWGRKTSIVLSCAVGIAAVLVYSSYPSFWVFLFGEFLFALHVSLLSGAGEALVYDSLKKAKMQSGSKGIFARIESFHLAGIMIGSLIGAPIASFGVQYPMMLTAIPLTIALLISLTFKEPAVSHKSERKYFSIMKEGTQYFFRKKVLMILAFDMISIATVAYFWIWLYQPALLGAGVNIAMFGFVHAGMVLCQIAFINLNPRIEKIIGSKKKVLAATGVLTGLMFLIGAAFPIGYVLVACTVLGAGFGLSRGPLFSSYLNKHIPSPKRATVISTVSMFRRLVLVVVNPMIGLLADHSLRLAFLVLGGAAIGLTLFSGVEERHLLE